VTARPGWLLFDLNGTLLDPGEKREQLQQAVMLAMAETLSGGYRPFSELLPDPPEPRLFDDVKPGLEALAEQQRLAVLTNSSTAQAREALRATGIDGFFEFVAGSDEVEAFKPDPRVYRVGIARAGVAPGAICMVAAHAWDLLGARRSGLATAYLARERAWPPMLDAPDHVADDLLGLTGHLT
jgi:2-haloacid dehalogenase